MSRAKIVIGNWKMNPPTIEDAVALARAVSAALPSGDVQVGVAPPSVALLPVSHALQGSRVAVYAQDVSAQEKGAYTGQTATSMLRGRALGSIVGHSEVRRDLGDDDVRVATKLARALTAGLRVVLCVGESEQQYLAGQSDTVVARQIAIDVAPLQAARDRASELVVAYEPIWAIGTGRPATGAHAARIAAVIRGALDGLGLPGGHTSILYGGSVTAAGVKEFASADGIDGALVGGASLKPDEFADIVRAFA